MLRPDSTLLIQKEKETERIIDVIMYILSLTECSFRFVKGYPPFDFLNINTVIFLTNKNLAFLQDIDTPYETAHQIFLKEMFQAGWQYGSEDFIEKSHPDLVSYEMLSLEAKSRYAFSAAMIQSAKDFYFSLKSDLESELMDSICTDLQGRSITTISNINMNH